MGDNHLFLLKLVASDLIYVANDLLEKLGSCKRFEPSSKRFVSKLYTFAIR